MKKILLLISVFAATLSAQGNDQNLRSHLWSKVQLRSFNYSDKFIRHKNFLGYIEPLFSSLDNNDSTFVVTPGLANQKCFSFESVNFPGFFLRHQFFRVKLQTNDGSNQFKKDSTFCQVPGLANAGGLSLRSLNFPNRFIRHRNFELWLDQLDGTYVSNTDATFIVN